MQVAGRGKKRNALLAVTEGERREGEGEGTHTLFLPISVLNESVCRA